jgi:RNA polymerase sigma factor (sigma-70 family)
MPLERLGALLHHLRRRVGAQPDGDVADSTLLDRFTSARDEPAFALLVARHGPLVLSVCRRVVGHQQDAEDVFQATFLILARRAAALRRGRSLASWLHTVASRLALRARADAARRLTAEPRALDMLPAKPDPAAAWRDLQPILDEELQRLPEKYRAPVILCYLEGHTHAEAAQQLGWPVGTVAGRLARARALWRGARQTPVVHGPGGQAAGPVRLVRLRNS